MTWQRQMCEDGSNENGNFYMLIWHGILWRDLREHHREAGGPAVELLQAWRWHKPSYVGNN